MQQNHLIKHSAAIHISNNISSNERKIFNICLKNAFPDLNRISSFSLPLKTIRTELGWSDNSEANELIKNCLRNLVSTSVEWNTLGKDRSRTWGVFTLLCSAKISRGILTYSYAEEVRELLGQPNIYAKLNLAIQKELNSKYALVLWEFLIDIASIDKRVFIETEQFPIEKLKKLFGLDSNEYYSDFKRFNEKILTPACKEVNKYSEINVAFSLGRASRKVTSIAFSIEKKGLGLQETVKAREYEDEQQYNSCSINKELYILSESLGVSNRCLSQLLPEFGVHKIVHNMNYIQRAIDIKKVKNIDAYLSSLLKKEAYLEGKKALAEGEDVTQDVESVLDSFSPYSFIARSVKQELGEKAFLSWFKEAKIEKNNKVISFLFLNRFTCDYVKQNFADKLINTIRKNLGDESIVRFSLA